MSTLVMKFGGSSIGTTAALNQVLHIVLQESRRWDHLILVVSALDGVTDALIDATHYAQLANRRGYRRIAATLRTRHLGLIEKLPLGENERNALLADLDRLLFDMLNNCQIISDNTSTPPRADIIDAVIGVGEKLSARMIATLLRQNDLRAAAIDTTDLIVTDDVHGNANPDMTLTHSRLMQNIVPMLDRDLVPVLTGFIAGTQAGKPTTLGRGGSDYTASILSVSLQAKEVWIWTDVDGIMSCDPRELPNAKVITEISYDEMAELAYFGARVLHSRMVKPLKTHQIPLRVKNVFKPKERGTLIHLKPVNPHAIKAVTAIQGIGVTAEHSGALGGISTLVDATFFNTIGSHTEVMFSSQSSNKTLLCFVIPTSAGTDAIHTIQTALEEALANAPDLDGWTVKPLSIITIIGDALNGMTALNSQIMRALQDVPLLAFSQSPAQCSVSVVVSPEHKPAAYEQLHTLTEVRMR